MSNLPANLFKWSALVVISVVAFFWRLGDVAFLENEGMYATIVSEMVSSGDWITLHFDGVRYFEKPPLWFWLTSVTVSAMGASELTIRLWSALSALGLVMLTYLLGRRLLDDRAAFFSAVILASSFVLPLSARRASTDLLFCVFLTLSIYGFVLTVQGASSFLRGPLLFYLGMGLAVLGKGWIGLLFPLLIAGLYILVMKERAVLRKLQPSVGIPVFLVLTVPWHLAASLENEGFLWYYLIEHHLLRFLGTRILPHDDIPASTLGFLLVTIPWFFPWSVLLPPVVTDLLQRFRPIRKKRASGEEKLWLLIPLWFLAVFGFFAVSSFKHEYYGLPAFPALALLVGKLWADEVSRASSQQGAAKMINGGAGNQYRWTGIGPWLVLSFSGSVFYLAALSVWREAFTTEKVLVGLSGVNVSFRVLLDRGIHLPDDFGPGVFSLFLEGGIFALAGFGAAGFLFYRRRIHAAFGILAGMGLFISLLILPFFRLLEPHYSIKAAALAIKEESRPGDFIVNEGPAERAGGLKFYTGHEVYVVNGQQGSLRFGSSFPDARRLFLGREDFLRRWNSPTRVFLVTNYPFGQSVRRFLNPGSVHEIGLYGSRRLYSNQPAERKTIANRTLKIG